MSLRQHSASSRYKRSATMHCGSSSKRRSGRSGNNSKPKNRLIGSSNKPRIGGRLRSRSAGLKALLRRLPLNKRKREAQRRLRPVPVQRQLSSLRA